METRFPSTADPSAVQALAEMASARRDLYRFLSAAFLEAPSPEFLAHLQDDSFQSALAEWFTPAVVENFRRVAEACSAGFQPAVSPTSSRQNAGRTRDAGDWRLMRSENPRYGRLEVCATGFMKSFSSFSPRLPRWLSPRRLALFSSVIGLAVIAISCATANRLIVAPPQIPGATYLGSAECETCHERITKEFITADHARLKAPGKSALEAGCESCHGPGSKHVESGGAYHTILNPRKDPETCFGCHLDKRGQFNLPHAHPVLAGKVSCSDCHNPHRGARFAADKSLLTRDETCIKCHTAQRGPYAFEHEAMREGCTTCHDAHGTVNAKMLTARNANLCLKCHVQEANSSVLIGGMPHSALLRSGTCWTAGCHEVVHGSQINATLRY
ncbi:MAG: hypothetical protein HY735_09590 [Verrucomicrobia bacterium]|nr:hypothetical protein [Verrucomicrobiota bacterium]